MVDKSNIYKFLSFSSLSTALATSIEAATNVDSQNPEIPIYLLLASIGSYILSGIFTAKYLQDEVKKFDNEKFESKKVDDIKKYSIITRKNNLKNDIIAIISEKPSYDYIIEQNKDSYDNLKKILEKSIRYNKFLYFITDKDKTKAYLYLTKDKYEEFKSRSKNCEYLCLKNEKNIPLSLFNMGEIKPYYIYAITDQEYFNLDNILNQYKPLILVKDESGKIFGYNPNTDFVEIKDNKAEEYIRISEEINGKNLTKYDLYNDLDNVVNNYKMLPIGFADKNNEIVIYSVIGADNGKRGKKELTKILNK